ncbi:aspartate--tRNA ligase [Streptomyces caniscabiei]|uniref:aspartate--tRNA ligase n=1 Tax=Streptomyces caniscabiei TaxID=2746961 RepID=UPI0029A6B76D|nr:aspartate--tRNA ligase [Streptomyces caniscabiei]MDX2776466.1 aspartate--tRNA ligase [Streptomyces caniscabiei]
MTRTHVKDLTTQMGQTVTVSGWVHTRRDHGGLIFIDLRDHTGIIQLVVQPEHAEAFSLAEHIRDEFVVTATGTVKEREETLKNPNIPMGAIEVVVTDIRLLNKSEPLPIPVREDAPLASEEHRLKYRYLDLRRSKMQETLKKRAAYYKFMRDYMEENDFTEVTTPILANSSPEGARDFLVPSRVHPGKFYALPQAPQQFKQLLMVGGVSRYYQIATCFRDEDPRADRLYGDFYQLDLEMAFVEDGEVVRRTMEPLIQRLVTEFAGKSLVTPDVPRIPYQEAMDRYGSDKPDLRFGMELVDLSDALQATEFSVFANTIKSGGVVKAICVEGGASLSRKQIDQFTDIARSEGAGGLAYITYVDGEIKSPIAKFLSDEELLTIKSRTGAKDGDAVFFGADKRDVANKVLGRLRSEFADHFNLKDPNKVALAWIVDFPFYEWDDKAKKIDFGHNPFSMPKGGIEALKSEDKLGILADQYDMVANGYEICSGAVRNHNPDVMYEVFGALGYDREYVDSRFGAMINAFKYGAPPHAGCAFGIDRIFMVLTGEDNIREVVAFPKNGSGVDAMMSSPSGVDPEQLKELSL